MTRGNVSNNDYARLPWFIQELLKPEAYPHPTEQIELRQTHISFVLLTGPYAYKIKKPVNFGFLDYSTLEKRELFCNEEVRLNKRLCPDIYLGVVGVSLSENHVRVGSGGENIDYAVKMVQLPEDRMMNFLLTMDKVSPPMVERLAEKLVSFYRHARTGQDVERYGEPRWIEVNTQENFDQTLPYVGRTVFSYQYDLIRTYTEDFLRYKADLFWQRIDGGFIREGHGDLRAGNICFKNGICIFDCIEFNERFRCGDTAADIAFLAMDLDRVGHSDLAGRFVNTYIAASGDKGLPRVLDFYKVYRAYVRGKVESFKLDEPEISESEKQSALQSARAYFELALSYVEGRYPSGAEQLGIPETFELGSSD